MIGWLIFGLAVAVVLLTSLFKTINLSTRWKTAIALVLSVISGAVTIWIAKGGDFTTTNLIEAVGLIFASSQVIYDFIFKNTSFDQKLTSVTLNKVFSKSGD